MSSKVILEILTSDSPQAALARVSKALQSLSGYKVDSIKSSPTNTLFRADSKDNLDDSNNLNNDFNDVSNPSHIQKAVKENRFDELIQNNQARLDSIRKEQEAKEISADQALLDAKEDQKKRIESNNKY